MYKDELADSFRNLSTPEAERNCGVAALLQNGMRAARLTLREGDAQFDASLERRGVQTG